MSLRDNVTDHTRYHDITRDLAGVWFNGANLRRAILYTSSWQNERSHGGGDGKDGKRKAKMEAVMEASTRIDG